jgi:hypothetical protein
MDDCMQKILICIVLLLTLNVFSEARAEGFDIGVGLGFVDSGNTEAFDGGGDLQVGYEMIDTEDWNFGAQLHLIKGLTSQSDVEDERLVYSGYDTADSTVMAFDSQAFYFTARPEDWWLQFKAGIVHGDYHTVNKDVSDIGTALGVGIVLGSDDVRLHVLDFHRYQIGGDSFNVYSISIGILFPFFRYGP